MSRVLMYREIGFDLDNGGHDDNDDDVTPADLPAADECRRLLPPRVYITEYSLRPYSAIAFG